MQKHVEPAYLVDLYECTRNVGENGQIHVQLRAWSSEKSNDVAYILSYEIESKDKSICYPMAHHRLVLDALSPAAAIDMTLEAVNAFSANPARHFLAWFYDFSTLECGL
ncbi:hypothetical protein [Desulfovibrio inopinatus]|uniref:hypothetical protein n=1 Tax=Desulfovibrio inopinatus TaxID=102109 RepID=UPI00041D5062|nr:hypothetical protein [Desulfovibrio inopinatus]